MSQNSRVVVRIDAQTKATVEKILKRTGMKMSEAMRIYLQKIIITNGMPFEIRTRKLSYEDFLKLSPDEMSKYLDGLTDKD